MILGIVGSYRKKGTIDQTVSSILAAARDNGAETKKICLHELNIEFCNNCRDCAQEHSMKMIGAKPVATIYIDLSARQERQTLRRSTLRKTQRAAGKL